MSRKKKRKHRNPFNDSIPKIQMDEVVSFPIRLNKFIAKCGVCSRRKAAELVKKGDILINGEVVLEPYIMVSEGDTVTYKGKTLRPEERLIYLLMNKPRNYITTTSDEKDRKTVLDLIQEEGRERLYPVGRLDRNTTGLLLLTNDGDLAKKLSHPSHKVKKEYLVTLDRDLTKEDMHAIRDGLLLADGSAPVQSINWYDENHKNQVVISIQMGRNRIVRRIFEHLDYAVKSLDRTYYAGLSQKNLGRGKYRTLTNREIIMLKHFT